MCAQDLAALTGGGLGEIATTATATLNSGRVAGPAVSAVDVGAGLGLFEGRLVLDHLFLGRLLKLDTGRLR